MTSGMNLGFELGGGGGVTAAAARDSVTTRAALAAVTPPTNGRVVYCAEVDASYQFVSASVATANGWLIIEADDNTPGRWLLVGTRVSVAAMSWASFAALWAAAAYSATIEMRPGLWTCDTAQTIPSGTHIVGSAGVIIVSTLTPTGNVENGVFFHVPTATVATTLSAPTIQGETTLHLTNVDSIENYAWAAVDDGSNHVVQYQLTSPDGLLLTATTDRPIMHDFAAGANVLLRTPPLDIKIHGNGMVIVGTADTAIELSGARNCEVTGIVIPQDDSTAFAETLINLDVGACRSSVRDCHINGNGFADSGINAESADECSIESCSATGCAVGFLVTNSFAVRVFACRGFKNGRGLQASNGSSAYSARSVSILGCVFDSNSYFGIDLENGARRILIANTECRGNDVGLAVNGGSAASRDVLIANCNLSANLTHGLYVAASSVGCKATGITASDNGGYGVYCDGDLDITSLMAENDVSGAVVVNLAAKVTINGLTAICSLNGFWAGVYASGSVGVNVSRYRATMSGTGTKLALGHAGSASGASYVENASTSGGTYGALISAGSLVRGPHVDFSSASTPFSGTVSYDETFAEIAAAVLTETGATLSRADGASLGDGGLIATTENGVKWTLIPEASGGTAPLQVLTFVAHGRLTAATPLIVYTWPIADGTAIYAESVCIVHELTPTNTNFATYERRFSARRVGGTAADILALTAISTAESVASWSHAIQRTTNSLEFRVDTGVTTTVDFVVIGTIKVWTFPTS